MCSVLFQKLVLECKGGNFYNNINTYTNIGPGSKIVDIEFVFYLFE